MNNLKNRLKKIPLIGNLLVSVHRQLQPGAKPIKGSNNEILNLGVFENVTFDIVGDNNRIEVGKNSRIRDTLIYMRGNNHKLVIKENCNYDGGELWIEDNNGAIIIHGQTTVEHAHLAVTEPFSILEIHKDCMLARNVEIRTGDSHSIIDTATRQRINKAANVFLGEHVWIGAHVKILKGVTIGSNSVIGTGSIVTSSIPSDSVAAGVPAKVIRQGITWDRGRI